MINNVINYYASYKTGRSKANVAIIKHQTDSVRERLYGGISTIADMNDLNINPIRQKSKSGIQIKQSELQVNSVLYAELLKNLEIAELTLKKDTPLIQIVDKPELPLKNKRLGKVLAGLAGLLLFSSLTSLIIGFRYFLKQRHNEVLVVGN
jgi:hypothetical protein